MKKIIPLFAAFTYLFGSALFAQKAAPTVATIDIQLVLKEYGAFQAALSKVRDSVQNVEKEMQRMQESLQAIVAEGREVETAAQNPAASDEARKASQEKLVELQKQLQSEQATLRQYQQQAQKLSQEGQKKELEPLQQKALETSKEIAQEMSVDLLLPSGALVYSAPALDLSQAVIDRLNAQ
jgi:Skp family chaperone for outer membrane proteins